MLKIKQGLTKLLNNLEETIICFICFDTKEISATLFKFNGEKIDELAQVRVDNDRTNKYKNSYLSVDSIAKCLDILEEKANIRIKSVIMVPNIKAFKSLLYSTDLQVEQGIGSDQLGEYIDLKAVKYSLGSSFVLTNFYPNKRGEISLRGNSDKKSVKAEFAMVGYEKSFVFDVYEICNNLSLKLEGIIFPPMGIPYLYKDSKDQALDADTALVYLCKDSTLIFNQQPNILKLGSNCMWQYLSTHTDIPLSTLNMQQRSIGEYISMIKRHESISDSKKYNINKSIEIKQFFIEDLESIIQKALINYASSLKNLFEQNNLITNNKRIIIVGADASALYEYEDIRRLLSSMVSNKQEISFASINMGKIESIANHNIQSHNNNAILNYGVAKYYRQHRFSDIALMSFRSRLDRQANIDYNWS